MNDGRDDALAAVLDRTAMEVETVPPDTLLEVIRRGTRKRRGRFTVIVAALTAFVGVVGWVGLSFPKTTQRIPADVADWRAFASLEDNGWTMQIPPPWRVQELPACPNAPERIGVIVTNTSFEFRNPLGEPPQCEDRFVFAGFPHDGVALAFMPVGVRIGDPFFPTKSVFPLEPDMMKATGGIRGGPKERFASIWVGNQHLAVIRRWVGPGASPVDVEALDQMLHSLTVAGATPRWVDRSIVGPGGVQVTFRVPSYWRSETFPAIEEQDVFQPLARLTTPDVEDGHCPGAPESMGFDNLGDGGTVIVVSDGAPALISREVGSRPTTFRPRDATEVITVHCGDEIRVLSFLFREGDRPILIQVAKARYALNDQPELLRYILDRIRVTEASAG